MFCFYCGSKLPDDALFCNKCGRRQVSETDISTKSNTILPTIAALPGNGQQLAQNLPVTEGTPQAGNVPVVQGTPPPPAGTPGGQSAPALTPAGSAPTSNPLAGSDAHQMLVSHPVLEHSPQSPGTQSSHPLHHQNEPKRTHRKQSDSLKKFGHHLSRRAVITGLAGGTIVVVGGSIGLGVVLSRKAQNTPLLPSPFHSPPASTPSSQTPLSRISLFVATWFTGQTYSLRASDGSILWQAQGGSHADDGLTQANGVVYTGSTDSSIYAQRVSDGALLWRYTTGGIINSPPAVADQVIYNGSWDHYLYALRATDGSLLWRFQTGNEIHTKPVIVNGVVYFGSIDGYVYALRATDGSLLWRFQIGGYIFA